MPFKWKKLLKAFPTFTNMLSEIANVLCNTSQYMVNQASSRYGYEPQRQYRNIYKPYWEYAGNPDYDHRAIRKAIHDTVRKCSTCPLYEEMDRAAVTNTPVSINNVKNIAETQIAVAKASGNQQSQPLRYTSTLNIAPEYVYIPSNDVPMLNYDYATSYVQPPQQNFDIRPQAMQYQINEINCGSYYPMLNPQNNQSIYSYSDYGYEYYGNDSRRNMSRRDMYAQTYPQQTQSNFNNAYYYGTCGNNQQLNPPYTYQTQTMPQMNQYYDPNSRRYANNYQYNNPYGNYQQLNPPYTYQTSEIPYGYADNTPLDPPYTYQTQNNYSSWNDNYYDWSKTQGQYIPNAEQYLDALNEELKNRHGANNICAWDSTNDDKSSYVNPNRESFGNIEPTVDCVTNPRRESYGNSQVIDVDYRDV